MKRILITIITVLLMSPAVAQDKELSNAVTMVSYEQGWLDSRGTLALKNNTSEGIHNVSFQITYLDMSGNPLDYEVYTKDVEIAPGMTRKVDVPAYEYERSYHYYKSENSPTGSPSFKVKFELKDYSTAPLEEEEYGNDDNIVRSAIDSGLYDGTATLIGLLFVLLFLGAWVGLYVLVAVMAQKRHRSAVLWVLLSIIASPLLIVIILLIVGDDRRSLDEFER